MPISSRSLMRVTTSQPGAAAEKRLAASMKSKNRLPPSTELRSDRSIPERAASRQANGENGHEREEEEEEEEEEEIGLMKRKETIQCQPAMSLGLIMQQALAISILQAS